MKILGRLGLGLGLTGSLLLGVSVAHAAPESARFALDGVSGTVSVKGASAPKSGTAGTELSNGDTVTTAKASTADIGVVLGNRKVSTIQVWQSSSYTVGETTVDENGLVKSTGTLAEGSISGSFSPKVAGSELSISTPKGSAVVRDSSTFLIQSAGNVYCYSGSVLVTSGGNSYTVLPGQSFVAATSTLVPHNLPAPLAQVSAPVLQITSPTTSTSQPGGQ